MQPVARDLVMLCSLSAALACGFAPHAFANPDAAQTAWTTTSTPASPASEASSSEKNSSGESQKEIATTLAAAVTGHDEDLYPTASQCGECHKQIYDEWSSSNHAYASI